MACPTMWLHILNGNIILAQYSQRQSNLQSLAMGKGHLVLVFDYILEKNLCRWNSHYQGKFADEEK